MDSRELYPSDEQRRRIMDFIMAAGETLLENGAEVFRVEQTMEIMARSFHLREFHVYVLTTGRDRRSAERAGADDSLRPGGRGERPFPRDSSRGRHTGRG